MTSADTCLNCGREMRGDAKYCDTCAAPRHPSERETFGSKDDPWGDRQIEAEEFARDSDTREDDRLASMGTRTGAYLINGIVPNFLLAIPILGWLVWAIWQGVSIWKWRRGQDIGATVMKVRVVRDNGDVAGFYHMWTRNLAATISLFALGAGFWTAYSDQRNQTWHDKWMGTYVIWDNPDVAMRPGTSSSAAKKWFWATSGIISLILFATVLALIAAI